KELAGMGVKLEEDSYQTMIRHACGPAYRDFFESIIQAFEIAKKSLTSTYMIDKVQQKADEKDLEKEEDLADSALAAAKAGPSKGGHGQDCRGNQQGGNKGDRPKCKNCGRTSHDKSKCWSPGGGAEGQGPYQKGKSKKGKSTKTAAVVASGDDTGDDDFGDFRFVVDTEFESDSDLRASSDFSSSDALAAANITHNSEIVDTGASRHFSPILLRFRNLVRLSPKPITTADGHSFTATAKRRLLYIPPYGIWKETYSRYAPKHLLLSYSGIHVNISQLFGPSWILTHC
ncbi:hypothetical protein BDP27DRAFT_1236008, partial [Rhodocollybia butyracea]